MLVEKKSIRFQFVSLGERFAVRVVGCMIFELPT